MLLTMSHESGGSDGLHAITHTIITEGRTETGKGRTLLGEAEGVSLAPQGLGSASALLLTSPGALWGPLFTIQGPSCSMSDSPQCHAHRGQVGGGCKNKRSHKCKENGMKLPKIQRTITIILELLLWRRREGRWCEGDPRQE